MNSANAIASPFARLRGQLQGSLAELLPARAARLDWTPDQLHLHQTAGLRTLLAHALEHSPFYARRLGGGDPGRMELDDLARLPITTKAEMMLELDDVFTDRALSRALVEDAIARTGSEPVVIHEKYLALVTGGSSGQRGLFVSDGAAIAEFQAAILRAVLRHTGAAPAGPQPTFAIVGAASAVHATGQAAALSEGGRGPRIVAVPVTLPLEEIAGRLTELAPVTLLGYPTVLARLARERAAGRLAIAPRFVGTTGEALTPALRRIIRQDFGVPVIDLFACSEGLVGVTPPDEEVFVFNTDNCIVELLDEGGRPVAAGQPAARVLVTNLVNRIQPLIRYELGDRFIRHPASPGRGHLRAAVEGRQGETLVYGRAEIHTHIVRSVLLRYPDVLDYCARQTARGLDIAISASAPVDTAALVRALAAALAEAGLAHPVVRVEPVASLPRDARTGKLRRFLPLDG
jgi:phenylacetate-coenzyme A ligase PaaK-like adenylate-forming protein